MFYSTNLQIFRALSRISLSQPTCTHFLSATQEIFLSKRSYQSDDYISKALPFERTINYNPEKLQKVSYASHV